MKSRKSLKKEIKKTFNTIYQEIIFYNAFVENADTESSEQILDEIITKESELIKRVSVNEGESVKGRRKMYFTKLRKDLKEQTEQLIKKISNLPH